MLLLTSFSYFKNKLLLIIMRYYNIIFLLLLFQGCNTTTLSEIEANNISNIQVKILIEDGIKKTSLNKINVYISNGEKRIINENIKVLLNGQPLKLFIRTGNYYDKYPVYLTDDLVRRESYYFEIILPDSAKYPIAYIKPSKITSKFNFPKNISLDEDFVLNWKTNNTLANVELWKLVHQKDKTNMHSGGRYAKSTIHHTINTKKGNYKVPKLFYEDSLTIADYLKIRISSEEGGLINPKLITNSKISYTYAIEQTISLEN